jgi:hypothetical protein
MSSPIKFNSLVLNKSKEKFYFSLGGNMFGFFDSNKACIYNDKFKIIFENISLNDFKESADLFLNDEIFSLNKNNVNNRISLDNLEKIKINSILNYKGIEYIVDEITYNKGDFIHSLKIKLKLKSNSSTIISIAYVDFDNIQSVLSLKSLKDLKKQENVYFKLKDSNFAIYDNQLYFFDDKYH